MTRPRTRWRWLLCGATVVAAMSFTPTVHGQGRDTADELAALLPEDLDALSSDEVDSIIAEMFTVLDEDATATPGGSDGSSELTGPCGGVAFSFDEDGSVIDVAYDLGDDDPPQDLLDGGQAFTGDNPFVVDTGGRVSYLGFAPRSGDGPRDHSYSLQVAGFTVTSGGDPNENGNNRNAGTIDIGDEMPIDLSVAFTAGGKMEAPDFPTCEGTGHVEFQGAGLLSPIGLIGMGAAAIGAVGLFVARPARTWRQG